MKFCLLINVRMPTIVGILTFMSRKNSILGLSEPKKGRISWYFNTYEHLDFHAQLSWAWKKFCNLGAWTFFLQLALIHSKDGAGMADSVDHDQISAFGMSYQGLHCFLRLPAGLSIPEIWGRNSAPFPKPKSMFFSQFQMKNSQSDQVCLVQENLGWINAKYNKNLLKLKKVSTTYCFYIRKHLKLSISNTERPSFFRRGRLQNL